jgi:hypothetical protein
MKDNSAGANSNQRAAEWAGGPGPGAVLTVDWETGSGTGNPTFQAGSGPHSSGSYYYDGVDDCFRSINDISSGNENHIGSNDVSTSLWFKRTISSVVGWRWDLSYL